MAETTEVVARPVSGQSERAYSYFRGGRRNPSLSDQLIEGLAGLQPGLQKYLQEKVAKQEQEQAQAGRRDALSKKEKQSDAEAYLNAYEDIQAKASLVQFQGDLSQLLQQASSEGWDAPTWTEKSTKLFAAYTAEMPPMFQEKFAPPALHLLGNHAGSFRNQLAKQFELETLEQVGSVAAGLIDGQLATPSEDPEEFTKGMRKTLSDMRKNAKDMKINSRAVSEKFLQIAGERAIREGRPDLLEWIYEKDESGIALIHTELGGSAGQMYRQAVSAQASLASSAAAAEAKLLEQQKKQINNQLLVMGSKIDGRDAKGIQQFINMIDSFAAPHLNPYGVMIDPSSLNVLLGYADKVKQLNGFSEKSDFFAYTGIYGKALHGKMDIDDLAIGLQTLNETDARSLMEKNAQMYEKMQDETFRRKMSRSDKELNSLEGIVAPKDDLTGAFIDTRNGPYRVAYVRSEWNQWIDSFIEQDKFPGHDELIKKRQELEDSAFKAHPQMVDMSRNRNGGQQAQSPQQAQGLRNRLRQGGSTTPAQPQPQPQVQPQAPPVTEETTGFDEITTY
jgi:hypothetical protein